MNSKRLRIRDKIIMPLAELDYLPLVIFPGAMLNGLMAILRTVEGWGTLEFSAVRRGLFGTLLRLHSAKTSFLECYNPTEMRGLPLDIIPFVLCGRPSDFYKSERVLSFSHHYVSCLSGLRTPCNTISRYMHATNIAPIPAWIRIP